MDTITIINNFTITPAVDATQEFIEIANDFSNPLDIVREAISNSYDAKSTEIGILFDVENINGESILKITLQDNGIGMTQASLQSFFDLGNSTKRLDPSTIGEKGHGTKVFFNSKKVEVFTSCNGKSYHAVMIDPFRKLHNREIPTVDVSEKELEGENEHGTKIIIYGYNNNRRDKFTHEILKDHILWFTKHGSVENILCDKTQTVKLFLKGLGQDIPEEIRQGHVFPEENCDLNKLFELYLTKSPDYYCKRIIKTGQLKNFPEIRYQAVFSIEGKYAKYWNNPMLRRPGYQAPQGAYTIQERYGLWICKDFMPIQRKNEWITFKGSEYTKFHAFVNCQNLRLTANRGSIENTPNEIIQDLQYEVRKIYDDIVKSGDYTSMEWLEDEAYAHQTTAKEKANYDWRIKKINRSNVAKYKDIVLVEPERETGVLSIFTILSTIEPSLFPFQIIDYDAHEGIDVIAKGDRTTPIINAKLFYVEFKRTLKSNFNHSFEHLHSIVCWETDIKHDDILKDINGEERKMIIVQPNKTDEYTKYYLDNPRRLHKIEVFVLKIYLKEKLSVEFLPRTSDAVL